MQPLFTKRERIFVNPDLRTESGRYVLIKSEDPVKKRHSYGS
jgi:hypothetical protein